MANLIGLNIYISKRKFDGKNHLFWGCTVGNMQAIYTEANYVSLHWVKSYITIIEATIEIP